MLQYRFLYYLWDTMKAFQIVSLLIDSLVVLALEIGFLRMIQVLSVLALFMHHALLQLRPQGRRMG